MNISTKNHISTLYFRNGYLLWLTVIILLIAGLSAITNLPRLEDPRITQRGATILTFLPGASADRVEALINEKIEDALEEISEIKTIESTARSNVSSISIELQDSITDDTNEEIFSKIRSRLQNVEGELPSGSTIPFLDDERGAIAYSLIVGLSWKNSLDGSLNILQRTALDLKDRMLNTPNTELVRVFGDISEEITVTPDQGEIASLNLTPRDIAELIQNSDSKVSSGQLRSNNQDLRIEVTGALDSVSRVKDIPVTSSESGTMIRLGDIADVSRNYKEPSDQLGFKDGNNIIYVAVRSEENVRLDKWNKNTQKVLTNYKVEYDSHFDIESIFIQNNYAEDRLNGLVANLIAGALIVVFIVFLIMGWKAGLVVGAALPLSAAGALFSLNFFNEGIHQMSIFGMIIAIGLLIDSAIVMTDEIRKQIHRGVERIKAMENAIRHLFVPLLASTFTTILGFMPIFLLPGNAGDFVSPIAISVVMALGFSFFLAMTVIPSLATRFTHYHQPTEKRQWWHTGLSKPKVFEDIKSIMQIVMRKPLTFAVVAMAPALFGFALISTMDIEFFPPGDRDMFEIQVWTSSDSSIHHTHEVIREADSLLKSLDGIEKSYWLVGASIPPVYYNQIPTQDNNNAYAQAVVVAQDPTLATKLIVKVQNILNKEIPEAKFIVKRFAQGPPTEAPIEFRVLGPNLDTLRNLGENIRGVMHRFPEVAHSRASIEGGEAKLWLNADEIEAEFVGLSLRDIADQLEGSLEGYSGGSILEGVQELPIRVRLEQDYRNTTNNIASVLLTSNNMQGWLPSSSLGEIELRPELPEVTRYNGQRVNNIYGFITPDATAVSIANLILKDIHQSVSIPDGYSIEVAGDSENQSDAIGNLLIYAPILVAMIVATLVLTFQSAALATIVGLVGFLSVGLGMLALKIAGYPLGFNPLIGSIGLAGIAINDTIVVLAAILANEKAKLGDVDAIIDETFGCGRHILSTTFTTIGGFIPLLIFSGGSFWPPLSVVIAGGIGFSLILAMFFTPLAYKVYAGIKYRSLTTFSQEQIV